MDPSNDTADADEMMAAWLAGLTGTLAYHS